MRTTPLSVPTYRWSRSAASAVTFSDGSPDSSVVQRCAWRSKTSSPLDSVPAKTCVLGDGHRVRVDLDGSGQVGKTLPAAFRVQTEEPAAVGSHEPLVIDARDRGDPVVRQRRIGRRVAGVDDPVVEHRHAAERARQHLGARGAERVDVVVDETVKRVEAAAALAIDERQAGGRRDRHAAGVQHQIGDMVRDETFGASEDLLRAAGRIEQHEPVGGGDGRHVRRPRRGRCG